MKAEFAAEIADQLGAGRVIEPRGSLPQPAERLDPSGPVRPHELEVAVERLYLDSTSHRNLRERAGADPRLMLELIREIVDARGKMHNPETESGGVLLGRVSAVGGHCDEPPAVGDRIVTLGSLTLTPLRLEEIRHLDPVSPQVAVRGTAYVFDRAAWAPVPDDLPLTAALEVLDVCAAASQVRALAPLDGTVCVLGAGHAGKLALAAARATMAGGTSVAVDVDPDAIESVREFGLCDIGVVADLRDPLATLAAVRDAGAPAADLTVLVANASRCESTALLLTEDDGTVLLFSMATEFSHAALAADGIGSSARMLIGSGFSPDRGAYALDLVRRSKDLRGALDIPVPEPL